MAEAVRRRLEAQKRKLAGTDPSPLELSLAHNIVPCQFQVDSVDRLMAIKTDEGMSAASVAMCQRWLYRAQSRYLKAVKTLAVVRKLTYP